jgi:hypothetical protein
MGTLLKVGNFVNREIRNYCKEKAKEKRLQEGRKGNKRKKIR